MEYCVQKAKLKQWLVKIPFITNHNNQLNKIIKCRTLFHIILLLNVARSLLASLSSLASIFHHSARYLMATAAYTPLRFGFLLKHTYIYETLPFAGRFYIFVCFLFFAITSPVWYPNGSLQRCENLNK